MGIGGAEESRTMKPVLTETGGGCVKGEANGKVGRNLTALKGATRETGHGNWLLFENEFAKRHNWCSDERKASKLPISRSGSWETGKVDREGR